MIALLVTHLLWIQDLTSCPPWRVSVVYLNQMVFYCQVHQCLLNLSVMGCRWYCMCVSINVWAIKDPTMNLVFFFVCNLGPIIQTNSCQMKSVGPGRRPPLIWDSSLLWGHLSNERHVVPTMAASHAYEKQSKCFKIECFHRWFYPWCLCSRNFIFAPNNLEGMTNQKHTLVFS